MLFLVTPHGEPGDVDTKVITNASVEDAHDVAHVIATEWAKAHQHMGKLTGKCGTNTTTGMPQVNLFSEAGHIICRIDVRAVELVEPVADPMDILTQIFGEALQASDIKSAPPEIKEILARISADPHAPPALRDILKKELDEAGVAPAAASGVTLH